MIDIYSDETEVGDRNIMSKFLTHAYKEFSILGWPGEDDMQKMACDNVIQLLSTFSEQGHSGSSAPYVLALFNKLARFEPLSPLTGEDDEWIKVGSNMYQNKRDCEVFKDDNGEAYWSAGKIFKYKDGGAYTSKESRVTITFPWTRPKQEIIEV